FFFFKLQLIPLDTAKVRLQLQKKAVAGDGIALPKYKGMLGTVGTIAREEGLASLWKGIVPGLHRQCLFGGLRIGLYEPVRSSCFFISRALAISIANPVGLLASRANYGNTSVSEDPFASGNGDPSSSENPNDEDRGIGNGGDLWA
ncbi:mitochondrial uncoupling protein 1, partial [Tanacetum coccineum]